MASYACYRPESNGDRSESIGRNGDDRGPVSFMVLSHLHIRIYQMQNVTSLEHDEYGGKNASVKSAYRICNKFWTL